MAIPPVSVAVGEDELKGYYERIIKAIDIPVIIQDASGYVGKPMSIALQAGLFNEYPEQVLFKPEATPIGPRLTALREATGGRAPVFEGTGGIALVDSYRRGVVGTMPGADLIDALVALWRALQAGDEQRIYRLSAPLAALIAVQTSLDAFLAVEKYLLFKRGIFKNRLIRGPVGYSLDEETRQSRKTGTCSKSRSMQADRDASSCKGNANSLNTITGSGIIRKSASQGAFTAFSIAQPAK